jgi:hypothetical protein
MGYLMETLSMIMVTHGNQAFLVWKYDDWLFGAASLSLPV